eukprot:GHVU01224198.1.p1 GENE.GHVU01224198.1~~GHVU01224198.1.p1  ORF type:complete len:147 (+),score=11.14 GHVU01224198.1:24-464(+)
MPINEEFVTEVALEIVARLQTDSRNDERTASDFSRHMIGIAGIPGAGKTTFSNLICRHVNAVWKERNPESPGDISVVVPMDGFHFTKAELAQFDDPVEARKRRGAPWTFNIHKLSACLKSIKFDQHASAPGFDRTTDVSPLWRQVG